MIWENGGIRVDSDGWPVVRVKIPALASVEDFERLLRHYRRLCADAKREIVWIIDFAEFNPVVGNPGTRRAAAEVFRRNEFMLARATACEVRIVQSALTRGVLVAFDWITGTAWPIANVDSEENAIGWIESQLSKQGRTRPQALRGPTPKNSIPPGRT